MDIKTIIELRKEELFEILSNLIKIDSESNGIDGKENEIAYYIAKEIEKIGYTPDVYCPLDVPGMTEHPDFWAEHNLLGRYNVSAVIPGKDHSLKIMLAAHSDTVAVGDEKNWTVDPFGGEIKNGKIWGRGANDDKFGIAVAIFLIKICKEENIEFPYDIVFTAYCNEEYGGGHGALAASLKYPCDYIINMDCKHFDICYCAVGGEEMKAYIKAKEPVDDAGVMLNGLEILKDEFMNFRKNRYDELMAHPEYAETFVPDASVRFLELKAGNAGADLGCAHVEVCYYAAAPKSQIDEEFDEMAVRLEKRLSPIGLTFDKFEKTTRFFHFEKGDKENRLVDKIVDIADKLSGRKIKVCGTGQSDLSLFLKYGSRKAISFGICGSFDDYGGAHQADENVDCGELIEFTQIIGELITNEF